MSDEGIDWLSSSDNGDPSDLPPENQVIKPKEYVYKPLKNLIETKAYWLTQEAQKSHGLSRDTEAFQRKIESTLSRICYTAMKRLSYRTRQEIDTLMQETSSEVSKRFDVPVDKRFLKE